MHSRFDNALQQLPSRLQSALEPILRRQDFATMLTADEAAGLADDGRLDTDALAFALLPLAAACALAPISHFQVGAIAQGVSGNFYFGANMEFSGAALQQTVHAEQSAISHAWSRNEPALAAITVNYTPCGHCRQFMNELNAASTLRIHLPGRQPALLGHYLPDAFGPGDLNISARLMDEIDHARTLPHQDALVLAALDAANRSHAPYTQALSGVALETRSGAIYAGRYAENAAFNPSLPPLQAALNLMNLAGERHTAIRRAVVVERRDAAISHWESSAALLNALGCKNVTRHFVQ
ncbi:cytidine deaminase [Brenneria tiliae]|uniref:cytidine deaminase n=1 Tax=Brenneria tiliae TaxID=2914984 RepID=UPI002014977E|nr:cytidine deaminase [Brenneria tiliae]MCL2895893.1 cytidine deaminase [Brenneria tiliae]MCL2900454.1 cytidine deaminase [Brenneria tiliae]